MGRLENYIPSLKKSKIENIQGKAYLCIGSHTNILLEAELEPFVKQITGHLSLREIFSFLNKKSLPIHIEKSLELLHVLSKRDCLENNSDYLKAIDNKSNKNQKQNPHLNQLSHSYFSTERLLGLIQKTTLFMQCERKVAENILNHSNLENVQEGVRLIKEGSKSPYFYILLAGEVGVYKKDECLAYLTPLSVFGESAAIFDKTRNADVITTNPCWVLKIDASKIVDTQSPESFDAYHGLKSRLILNQTLAANPLFQNIPSDVLQLFISKCRIEKYAKEQAIIEQGERSGDFYFILKGSVAVIKDGMPVTSIAEGDHFGEVAAMFHEPRTASIITETNSTFLVLNQKSLFDVLCSHFRLAVDMERIAQKRRLSEGNILNLFEDTFVPSKSNEDLEPSLADFQIDDKFIETTDSHFELEVFDFSNIDEEAS